jgi:hypothetical protein
MERLEVTLTMEGVGESNDGTVRPVH